MLQIPQGALLIVFPALVIVAAVKDLTTFTIPNWISAALALAFVPTAILCGVSLPAAGLHALVGLAGFAAAVAMFALGWIGGGDAKLFAAVALWLGWPAALTFTLVTALAGGALAVGLLAARSDWIRVHLPEATPAWALRLAEPGGPAPYGVAIAIGGLVAFPLSGLMQAFQSGL